MKNVSILIVFFAIIACNEGSVEDNHSRFGLDIQGLAEAIHLEPVATKIDLADYLATTKSVDSVWLNNEFLGISNLVSVLPQGLSQVNNLRILVSKNLYDIPLLLSNKRRVDLKVAEGDFKTIGIQGEMNGWNSDDAQFTKTGRNWIARFYLSPGEYDYMLLLDNEESLDPGNSEKRQSKNGTYASVLRVPGNNKSKLSLLFQNIESSDGTIRFQIKNATRVHAYWENHRLPVQYENNLWQLTLPEEANNRKRSHLRMWASNDYQYSESPFFPLEYGKVIESTNELTPEDRHSKVHYRSNTDRHDHGSLKNDNSDEDNDILPNIDVKDAIVGCLFGGESFERLKTSLYGSQKVHGAHHQMGNVSWSPEVDPIDYKKATLLNAIIASIPGVPVIYTDKHDAHSEGNNLENSEYRRNAEKITDEEKLLEMTMMGLMNFRRQNMAMMYGDFRVVEFGDDYIAIERCYLGQKMRLYINNSALERSFLVPPFFSKAMNGSTLRGSNQTGKFTLNANSFEIWTN